MKFKGNCPRCESTITVEVTKKKEDRLDTCVISNETYSGASFSPVCQADESFFEADKKEYKPTEDETIQPCYAYGPFYEGDGEPDSSNRDKISIECPVCNTLVSAQVTES